MRVRRARTFLYGSVILSFAALAISGLGLWASLIGKTVSTENYLGNAPQWVTALIAVGALLAAWVSIKSQREIARKRAALDFFAKTEMDKDLLSAHVAYGAAVGRMQQFIDQGGSIDSFVTTGGEDYWAIRSYLNLHELMAVGIKRDVLDDNVCYDFWSGELERCHLKTKALIDFIQKMPDEDGTYCEMIRVAERWRRRGR